MLANILVGVVILGLLFLLGFAWYVKTRHYPIIEAEIDAAKFDEVFPPAVVDKRQEITRVEIRF